jgi:hypothetical protein
MGAASRIGVEKSHDESIAPCRGAAGLFGRADPELFEQLASSLRRSLVTNGHDSPCTTLGSPLTRPQSKRLTAVRFR